MNPPVMSTPLKSPARPPPLSSKTQHFEKYITLLRIKINALWGFGTQDAIYIQLLAVKKAEMLKNML